MATGGWISTPALAEGGSGHDQLEIITAQVQDEAITAAKLDPSAAAAGRYGISQYGYCVYA